MTKYTVVIHYRGAINYTVEATNEEEAKELASELMMKEDAITLLEDLDWDVDDVWKE